MTYAQARLRLGICGVGWWVLLSCLGLYTGLARELNPWELALIYLLASIPLDLLGGQIVPMLWGKPRVKTFHWLILYLRALPLHTGLWLFSLWLCCSSYRTAGIPTTTGIFWLVSLTFFAYQLPLLGWLGVKVRRHSWGWEAEAADSRFAGGLCGLPWPGREEVVIPSHWLSPTVPDGLQEAIQRRRRLSQNAARAAGLMLALTFNSLVLSKALEWGGGQPGLTACWATLLSFLGLLILPSFSRPGVLAADQKSPPVGEWARWMEELQEEDFTRPLWIDRIFHPIPQGAQRQDPHAGIPSWGLVPWNLARYALVHSLFCGSLLSRAVHCNCGRPELWFWPPTD